MAEWKDLARKVAGAAPLLGSVLGGPAGGAVGTLIASAFDVPNTPDAVQLALRANPDAAERLQRLELEHAERLRELQLEQLRIEADDRHSARRAAVDGGYAYAVFAFAVLIFMCVGALEGALLLGWGDSVTAGVSPEMLGRVLGTLDACAMAAIYYIFGSSADTRRDRLP